jgi:ATP synthase protein I
LGADALQAAVNLKDHLKQSRQLTALSTVGLTLVFSTFIGLAIGLWLDRVLHTRPIFTIVLLLVGIAAGFVNIFRSVGRGEGD